MDVYVKETLYVIDYNNDIPDAELRNTIFVSDDHRTAGYAYNITIKEANTGYSDLTFSMPKTIIDENGQQVHNPKLDLLVPLVKLRYRRQVYYTGENEIHVMEPEGYGDATPWQDRVYSPLFPNNIIEDYTMDYVVQPVDKQRNVLEIAINFTAMDYPRFTLSKKKVGLLIDNDTVTKDEWSIVSPDHPMDRPGMIKYIPWDSTLTDVVVWRSDFPEGEAGDIAYQNALNSMNEWNPMTATSYPLTKEQVRRLKRQDTLWPYGFTATCFYWPIVETGRYQGVLYEEGGWIGFQGYDLLKLQIAGLDPELHTEDTAWHWTQIYRMKRYLTPNNAKNYLSWILDGTAWNVGEVDKRMIPVFNPATGEPEPEVEYTAYLNLSGSNCYNAITSLAQNFQLYPVFDCLTRTVHLRVASGKNYGLVYRLGDNIKSDSTKADGEKVITKLYVSGGSDNVGSANINIGTATREYFQNFQGFYQTLGDLQRTEAKGKWAVVDDALTDFTTTSYQLDYYNDEPAPEVTVMPEPTIDILNNIYHYIGENTDEFTTDFYYKCVEKYDDEHEEITYGWLDVTGVPYLKPVSKETHGLDVPNYWEAGPNRKVYYYNNAEWHEASPEEDGTWTFTIEETQYIIDPISGAQAPWDPNDEMYIMARSPYWTNYIMNLRWYYQNGWITKEQILKIYQYNLQINNLNKDFGDKYIQDRRATQTAYENAKNNYDIAQDGYQSTLYAMENKYYLTDGDFTSGYDYCFHVAPKDTYTKEDPITHETKHYIKLFHCYGCGYTQGIADNGQGSFPDIDHCPNGECPDPTNVVNNEIEIPVFISSKYSYDPLDYPYGRPTDKYRQSAWSNGYQYNPTLKGYYLRLVTALDRMDAREQDVWDIHDYEEKISLITPIEFKRYVPQAGSGINALFDNYTYVIPEDNPETEINEVYVRSTSGQIEVWNEAVAKYIQFYGLMLDYKVILDAAIEHIEQLEEVYESWDQIVQQLYANIQDEFGDFIVEGNYQNQDQPYVEILFNEGLEASDKYSIPEVTYNLDVVDASGLIEYRRPMPMAMPTKYTCEYCGYVSYSMPRMACINCGNFPMFRVEEHDIYNDLVRKLHSVGQIVPSAGDYVTIYDEPMGFFGVPGLITEVDRYLDDPIKNSIKIDTSYTNDEQLVGNIITATNTVLSNKDIYARTAFINADGTLDPNSIKDTLNTSQADISIVSTNGGVLLNGSGLRCIDPADATHAIKYTGTGIYKTTNLNNENGESEAVFWERMMGPDGINATYINSGTIDTSKLNIVAGAGSKVVLDKFGLYVKDATGASAHITNFDIERAKNEANYTNDWGATNNIASFVGIDNNNNPLIYTKGFLVAEEGSNIANWITSQQGFYHLSNTKKDIWLSPTGLNRNNYSPNARLGGNTDNTFAIYANDTFGVTPSGILYATGAHIGGNFDGDFNGDFDGDFNGDFVGVFEGKVLITDSTSEMNTGTVGGWKANSDGLQNETVNPTLILSPAGGIDLTVNDRPGRDWALYANGNFGVTTGGSLYASNAYIKGEIVATSGTIGGCSINNGVLSVSNTNISGRISADHLDAKTITTDNLNTKTISCDQLSGGTINAQSIKNSSFSGGSISLSGSHASGNFAIYDYPGGSNVHVLQADAYGIYCDGYSGMSDSPKFELTTYPNNYGVLSLRGNSSTYISGGYAWFNGEVNTPHVCSDGYLQVTAGNSYYTSGEGSIGTASGSIYIYSSNHITLHAGRSGTDKHVYVGINGNNNTRVAADSSGPSSRCLKTNITDFTQSEYQDALTLLQDINIYDYNYKYDIHPKQNQYGFIIDDLLNNPLADKFLYFKDEKAGITDTNGLDYRAPYENPDNEPIIEFKRYDEETLIKYLLVCCKALQEEIEQIKKKA